MALLHILAYVRIYKSRDDPGTCRSPSTSASKIKRIPVKEPTWRRLHDLKDAGQSYDGLLAGMIQRERDYRDGKMIAEIDRTGECVAFDPDEILKDE